ncbi:uncharacterized protein PRCAT00002430001 [Priceomyces carsonii]|uniref:uncharacterized protein n=1 Tax=Priceomyces carsonii TaxID=28549 RepID=UPI002ED81FD3|nr:unnamed protein product [Priceomyces carsonii]
MALAETILRKVHKLGLISKLIRLLPTFSLLLMVSSILWLFYLPLDGNYRNTYISENALMPAQVTSYFRESEWNFVRGYRHEIHLIEEEPIDKKNKIIEEWLKDIGLVTTYHKNERYHDTLYSVMHAPRGEDTEAMVLVAPWITSDGEFNEGGIALSLALARYFSKMSIWSKNIIIVYPENAQFPLRSWVNAYHTSLDVTAGSIEAAIIIEYAKNGDYFDYYEVMYEGLNGQLPNLDLLNTAILIGTQEGLKCCIQSTPVDELEKNTYYTRVRTLFQGVISLVLSGLKKNTPGCEAFSGWQIQAFTLKAKGSRGPHDVTQFGRIVDSTFRSVNNLLERFHQSFFFYLLLSPRNFVSIGTYLPSAVLVAISYALSSLSCLLNCNVQNNEHLTAISQLLTLFTSLEVFNLVLSLVLPLILRLSQSGDDLVAYIAGSLFGISILLSLGPFFEVPKRIRLKRTLAYSLMALSLFFISMLITTLLIVNFSLAMVIGFLSFPMSFIHTTIGEQYASGANLSKKLRAKLKIALCLIASNPFVIVYIYDISSLAPGEFPLLRGLLTSWDELQCWTWFLVMLGWFTAWLGVCMACWLGEFEIETPSSEKKVQ